MVPQMGKDARGYNNGPSKKDYETYKWLFGA
jgi:hypothetical protein